MCVDEIYAATLAVEQMYTVEPSGILPMYDGIASQVMFGSSDGAEQKNHCAHTRTHAVRDASRIT